MSEVITSGKVIEKPDIVLDENDFLPPGVIGVRPQTVEESSRRQDFSSRDDSDNELLFMDGDGSEIIPDVLPVPTFMKIISRVTKVGPDKKMLVDVVIETDDFPGISEFDARLTKSLGPA